jgi:Protein of unknown function (DUF3485)
MSEVVKKEVTAALKNKGFLAALVILAVAAIGLNTTMQAAGLYFKKERVELRQLLDTVPRQLGPWLQVNKDTPLPEEMEHALGTKEYINSRMYIDTRSMNGFDKAVWDSLSEKGREDAIRILLQRNPQAVVFLHVAFYTGLVDTVAHVPERCYVAGGFDPVNPEVVTMKVFDEPGRSPNLKLRYTNYVDRARGGAARNVAYLFQVNGRYEYDSIGGVRVALQSIREKYAYYAKIELMTQLGDNAALSQKTMEDFLRHAMPSIEKCLPDWTAVTGKSAALNNDW